MQRHERWSMGWRAASVVLMLAGACGDDGDGAADGSGTTPDDGSDTAPGGGASDGWLAVWPAP